MSVYQHIPVLLEESITAMHIAKDGCYIDATYGRGGHAAAILAQLGSAGRLLVIDQDPVAIERAQAQFADEPRVTVVHAAFAALDEILANEQWPPDQLSSDGVVDGVLFDLGISSPQVDDPARGFSFMHDGPLDMRMNPNQGQTVADYLSQVDETTLANVLYQYGEERYSRRIARAIIEARSLAPIERTVQLAAIVKQAHPAWSRQQHPATRSFQALRIAVNQELMQIEQALRAAVKVLAPAGRLAVISFHSLEDRIVKQFIRQQMGAPLTSGLPDPQAPPQPVLKKVGKLIRPSVEEVEANPRARSARLRTAIRL